MGKQKTKLTLRNKKIYSEHKEAKDNGLDIGEVIKKLEKRYELTSQQIYRIIADVEESLKHKQDA